MREEAAPIEEKTAGNQAAVAANEPPLPENWLRVIVTIWIGQACSILTAYSSIYAGVWYVTETTDSALMLALASLCSMLPQGLLSPLGGVVADRFNRKYVLIAADAFVGTVALIMGVIILMGHVSVPLVLIMGALRSVGQAFHIPAMESTTPMLVPKKHLVRINTLNQSLWSLALIVGPVFGIFLYTVIGFQMVLFLNAVGCALACLALVFAKIPDFHDTSDEARHPIQSLKAGFNVLRADYGLLVMAGIVMGVMAMYAGINSLFPLMTYDQFNGDGYMASTVEAAYGVMSLVGMGILFAWGGGRHLLRTVSVSGFFAGLLLVAAGLLTPDMFMWFVVLTGASGVVEAFFNGPLLAVLQKRVPPEKLGRVMGLFTTVSALSSPIGLSLAGTCAEFTGVSNWFIIAGAVIALCGVLLGALPILRKLDAEVAATLGDPHVTKKAPRAGGRTSRKAEDEQGAKSAGDGENAGSPAMRADDATAVDNTAVAAKSDDVANASSYDDLDVTVRIPQRRAAQSAAVFREGADESASAAAASAESESAR
ncbi:MFS transporter [uncultured Slackia sp.]|uniref:MFS transporter n=1 Tax=uncultured Slackia sp. TaxID=665903 RepID=UPI0025CF289D|nr:MFS transporter [uncultured Slackia sp.]